MTVQDNSGGEDPEFSEFEAAGEVTVGDSNAGTDEAPKPKPAPKPVAKRAASDEGDDGEDDADQGADEGEDEGEDEGDPKPKPKASDRIRELNKRLRNSERLRISMEDRLAAVEKRDLPAAPAGGNTDAIGDAPNSQDAAKYPLGIFDDRYIEDKLEWLAEKKAAERADAVLQRQRENELRQTAEQQHKALLDKVDDLSSRGSEQFDDFQEAVVDAGMKGEWKLGQATFEAASEVDNGPQILYELSQDKKEAARVAGLSSFQQSKFVADRDAEIAKGKTPRVIPRADAPLNTRPRGANSRTQINPATDNLDDFEKAWERDAKKGR